MMISLMKAEAENGEMSSRFNRVKSNQSLNQLEEEEDEADDNN
jgi:hypothetical protein